MSQSDDKDLPCEAKPSDDDNIALPIYPNAPESLIAAWQLRRKPLSFAQGEALPPLDCDLAALREILVKTPRPLEDKASSFAMKSAEVRRDFIGQPELCALNGILIAILRKRDFPDHAVALFHRLWREEGSFLLEKLSSRWLISSIITFGDHGETEAQRSLGQMMNVLLSLMKLYEYERLYSRVPSHQPFGLRRSKRKSLPLDMPNFSLSDGGLDINMLAPIWQKAKAEPLAGPIACRLLEQLNMEHRGLFRRLDLMRDAQQEAQAQKHIESLQEPPESPSTEA